MKRRAGSLVRLAVLGAAIHATGESAMGDGGVERRLTGVIPRPRAMKRIGGEFVFGRRTSIIVPPRSAEAREIGEYLAARLRRATRARVLAAPGVSRVPAGSIVLLVGGSRERLGDEGYELKVAPSRITLRAPAGNGLFHGVQTIRQLLPDAAEGGERDGAGEPWTVPCVEISDRPAYPWRGMLLDCCRHFMTKEFVKRYIDLLAYHKMNRLHWHLTEDQGWRIEIGRYPKLTELSAWRREDGKRYGGYYSRSDIREIVEHARRRYVTIVPEIEMPGHSQAALAAYPELSCRGGPFEVGTKWGIYKDVYCAGNERTFEFLRNVLAEVVGMFPGPYVHLGADEAPKDRWKECPKCQGRMRTEGLKDEKALQTWFVSRMARFLQEKGRTVICWDEILEGGAPEGVIVQAWRGHSYGREALKAGARTIVSPYTHVYADQDVAWLDLARVYSFDPVPSGKASRARRNNVIGSEICMWTEFAPQPTVDYKVFPRILALAEVLWTCPKKRDFGEFRRRAERHCARLERMGVVAGQARGTSAKAGLVRPGTVRSTITVPGKTQKPELSPERVFDGDMSSYYRSLRNVRKGDAVTLTLERPARFGSVKAYTGLGKEGLDGGTLDVSADGREFRTVARFENGIARARLKAGEVKAVRLRAARSLDHRLIVREIVLK